VAEWLPAGGGSAPGGKANMYSVYIIHSKTSDKTYTGYTSDIETRILEHNSGRVRSTKAFIPYDLIYREDYEDKTTARKRELYLKTGQGRKWVKQEVLKKNG
jgi:putative endonuclease